MTWISGKCRVNLLLSVLGLTSTVNGQVASVQGTVRTPLQAVRFASVTVTDETNPAKIFTALTDAAGRYRIDIVSDVEPRTTPPSSFDLLQNYPNPFLTSTTIAYILREESKSSVRIYNVLGHLIREYKFGRNNSGLHEVTWDGTNNSGRNVPLGVYFYQLSTARGTAVKKMLLGFEGRGAGQIPSLNSVDPGSGTGMARTAHSGTTTYTVTFESIDSTSPPFETKQLSAVTISGNTTVDATVSEAGDFAVCYEKQGDGNWQLYLNNSKGTHPRKISDFEHGMSAEASWSPDGTCIAFSRWSRIFVYEFARDTLVPVSPDSVYGAFPHWTADTKQIVFSGAQCTYVINREGTNLRRLPGVYGTLFYPNGFDFITSNSSDYLVHKSSLLDTSRVFLLDLKSIGKNYVFVEDLNPMADEILILADPTPQVTNLLVAYGVESGRIDTIAVADSGWMYLRPRYSHDCSKIALAEVSYSAGRERLAVLENGGRTIVHEMINYPGERLYVDPVAFLSDDRHLVYVRAVLLPGQHEPSATYVHIVDLDTKTVRLIDAGFHPVTNPAKPDQQNAHFGR